MSGKLLIPFVWVWTTIHHNKSYFDSGFDSGNNNSSGNINKIEIIEIRSQSISSSITSSYLVSEDIKDAFIHIWSSRTPDDDTLTFETLSEDSDVTCTKLCATNMNRGTVHTYYYIPEIKKGTVIHVAADYNKCAYLYCFNAKCENTSTVKDLTDQTSYLVSQEMRDVFLIQHNPFSLTEVKHTIPSFEPLPSDPMVTYRNIYSYTHADASDSDRRTRFSNVNVYYIPKLTAGTLITLSKETTYLIY